MPCVAVSLLLSGVKHHTTLTSPAAGSPASGGGVATTSSTGATWPNTPHGICGDPYNAPQTYMQVGVSVSCMKTCCPNCRKRRRLLVDDLMSE